MKFQSVLRTVVAVFGLHAGAHADAVAGLIFDNGFDECPAVATRACYDGPVGTEDVGTCQSGVQQCERGAWGPCTAGRTPVFESCNNLDDDCDVAIDNGLGSVTCGTGACQRTASACAGGIPGMCMPGAAVAETCDGIDNDCDGAIDETGCNCVHVAPAGSDTTGTGTATAPKRTIGAAISLAATSGPNVVCVAAGLTCPSTFNYDEAVAMRNGVHVYGGFQATGTTWPRVASCVTRIRAQDARGVYFDSTVTAVTILDGFTIDARNDPTNAAVTVQGSTGAVINNNSINGSVGTTSVGVNVIDNAGIAATPTLSNNAIVGGGGSALAVGVRSFASAPKIQGNCPVIDAAGRCSAFCSTASRYVRGRAPGSTGIESIGVLLESSPGTVVERNSICGLGTSTSNSAGVRLRGDATATVIRANNIAGLFGQQNAVGIWMEPCAGAAPWLVDNFLIAASSNTAGVRTDGIRVLGACHARIDHNASIVGGQETAQADATGVYCGTDPGSGVTSRCTILGNTLIQGSSSGFPPTSTGVRCEDGACARIEGNTITGRGGQVTRGLVLGASDTYVDGNVIQAGCAVSSGIGLLAVDSYARIQNNRIEGTAAAGGCSATAPASAAVVLSLGAGLNAVDLHSNDLFGRIGSGTCTSRGLAFDLEGAAPGGGRGWVRNNIVSAGACSTNLAVDELNAAADPRVLQNNDLWSSILPAILYRDEAASDLLDIAAVNALGDLTASGNIFADPLYTPSNTIPALSPCRDAGILAAAPLFDFQGQQRPQGPACDIGRDEFLP